MEGASLCSGPHGIFRPLQTLRPHLALSLTLTGGSGLCPVPRGRQKVFSPWGRPCPTAQAPARPGSTHAPPLCEGAGVGLSMLAGQGHSVGPVLFPGWARLPRHWGVFRDALLACRGVRGSAGLGVCLPAAPARGKGLGTGQGRVGAGRRPSVVSELGAPPGPALAPGPASDAPLLHLPGWGPPREPFLSCLGHSWLCPLLWPALGSVTGSSRQMDVSPAVTSGRRWPSRRPCSCTPSAS